MLNKITKNNLEINEKLPLKNLNILDVGCGGGLLSEPLAQLGGNVTGLDPAKELIDVAKAHAKDDKNLATLNYLHETLEDHAVNNTEKYDLVLLAQVLPHVLHWEYFVDCAIKCVKPGGSLIISTLNKTLKAKFVMIYWYTNILGILPKETLQYEKFTRVDEVKRYLRDRNMEIKETKGFRYSVLRKTWDFDASDKVHSTFHAIKQ